MTENQGMIETMTGAMSKAVEKLSSRKVGIAIVSMWLMKDAPTPEVQKLIFWLCVVALGTQLVQDVVEVIWTGKDLPDSNGKTPIMEDGPEDIEPPLVLPPKEC
jgi:hypothetical protein